MSNIFFGLNIGRSALLAHQTALDVTGHNLANVETEGYSRQRAEMAPSLPIQTSEGSLGSGVSTARIERLQLGYLERQIGLATVEQGYDAALASGLEELQTLLDEPSSHGLGAALTEFWNSWDALAARPTDAALRGQVLDQAEYLATVYNQSIDGLLSMEDRFDEALEDALGDVNAMAAEIVDLNASIAKAEAAGYQANDLRDQRDHLIRKISEEIGVESEVSGSYMNLRLQNEGPYLVNRAQNYELTGLRDERGQLTQFRVGSSPVTPAMGEMGALLELRDVLSPDLRGDLSEWMATVVDRVNELHVGGVDRDGAPGRNLFTWAGEGPGAIMRPSAGLSGIELEASLEPGTHHLEVTSIDGVVANDRGDLSAGAVSLSASGAYSGPNALNLDYHVRVVAANSDPTSLDGLRVQLFRGDEPAADALAVSGAGPASVTWAGVDGLDFDAVIEGGAAYVLGERSDGVSTTGRVSLDGGAAVAVDLTTSNNIVFAGGNDFDFLAGGTAVVNFSGTPFYGSSFTVYGPSARLVVDSVVAGDTDKVAAARTPQPGTPAAAGDGEIARQIADLATQPIFEAIAETASGFLSRTVQSLGAKGRDASIFDQASKSVLLQLDAQREAVSGVNVDEEMVQLLMYQRGFEAAARFLTTVDGLIETLIDRVGLVGR